ncbi:MAG: HEAT repeat domain-containing protein [Planctomycetota bacterium]|jgi:tetratricopeptide (TPR) repeat protein
MLAAMASLLALPASGGEWLAVSPSPHEPHVAVEDQVDDVPEAVRAARRTIVQGDAEIATLAVAAKTLLDVQDFETLRAVLSGTRDKAAHGLLRALTAQSADSYEVLMPDILELIGTTVVPAVRAEADAALARLAYDRPDVREQLKLWLGDAALDGARRVSVISALGASRNLGVVEPLIGELDGEHAGEAAAALVTITGHARGADRDVAYWTAFWDERRHLTREELFERELLETRELFSTRETKLIAENIELILDEMGSEQVEKLVAGLSNAYPEVRKTAAERLGHHKDKARAAMAVPAILGRLGHPAGSNGNGGVTPNGTLNGNGHGNGHVVETDPAVRAVLVTTLGLLGRAQDDQGNAREDVRLALVAELQSGDAVVGAAAAGSLQMLREESEVVLPLLAYLERTPGDDVAANVLTAIAHNRPKGVITRLVPWADASRPPRVRAAAVRAIMASDDAELALDKLEQIYVADESREVRFAMAAALGDRVRRLPADAPVRSRLVGLLGSLLEDVEPTVRVEAATALGKAGTETALALLEERGKVETDPAVLGRMIEALGALRFLEGGRLIGQIAARPGPTRDEFETRARAALALIGEQRGPADWLTLAQGTSDADAPALSAWCLRELIRTFEAVPEHADAVEEARGRLPAALLAAGDAVQAHTLLQELQAANAPHPSPAERLALLAAASEALGQPGDAADYHLALFVLLPEGESRRAATRRAAVDALLRSARYADALPHLRDLVADEPEDNLLLFDYAFVEEQLGQYDQAGIHLRRLLDRVPAEDAEFRARVEEAHARIIDVLSGRAADGDGEAGEPAGDDDAPASQFGDDDEDGGHGDAESSRVDEPDDG